MYYVDLFAGPGRCRIRGTEKELDGSPLIALTDFLGQLDLKDIHWVIVGGESGPRARLMKKDWVLCIKEQCRAARVPFFFKQWGGVRKSAAGRLLQGRTYDEFPERIQRSVPEAHDAVAWPGMSTFFL